MDQHLDGDTIYTLPTTLDQKPTLTLILDTPTARQLVIVLDPPSQNHSWREALSTSNLMKSKSSMKLPEGIAELGVLALHTYIMFPIYLNSAWQWGLEDTNKENWKTRFSIQFFFSVCPPGLSSFRSSTASSGNERKDSIVRDVKVT